MPVKRYNLRIAFSVTNCICNDQRVLKMAEVVSQLGADVTIIGRKMGSCCETDNIQFKTMRFSMLYRRGFLFYAFFNFRLFFFLLFHRFDILVANDLDTLLPNFIVSRLKRLTLVFDSHEYFTGVPELERRPFIRWLWKTIEKNILPGLKYTITVSDSIAGQYSLEYGISPLVIKNCSKSAADIIQYSREELGINPDHLLLVLQGTGINIERGAEELIESCLLNENHSLLIVGTGDIVPVLKDKVKKYNLSGRIKFFPKVPWEEMMRFTKTADAGVSLDKNISINQRFSLPNKIFDYISAGIPVIAGDLREVTKIITDFDCGIVVPEITPGEISKTVRLLHGNRELLRKLKQNARKASEIINWNRESEKVSTFYESIINKK